MAPVMSSPSMENRATNSKDQQPRRSCSVTHCAGRKQRPCLTDFGSRDRTDCQGSDESYHLRSIDHSSFVRSEICQESDNEQHHQHDLDPPTSSIHVRIKHWVDYRYAQVDHTKPKYDHRYPRVPPALRSGRGSVASLSHPRANSSIPKTRKFPEDTELTRHDPDVRDPWS